MPSTVVCKQVDDIPSGKPGEAWYQSGTFTKTHVISIPNTELIYSIILPTIPHPVWQILRYSEAVKRQFTKILSVADYIRAE